MTSWWKVTDTVEVSTFVPVKVTLTLPVPLSSAKSMLVRAMPAAILHQPRDSTRVSLEERRGPGVAGFQRPEKPQRVCLGCRLEDRKPVLGIGCTNDMVPGIAISSAWKSITAPNEATARTIIRENSFTCTSVPIDILPAKVFIA